MKNKHISYYKHDDKKSHKCNLGIIPAFFGETSLVAVTQPPM